MGFYALTQYPGGRLSDELSRKTLLVAGLGLLVVGSALFVATVDYVTFVVGASSVGTLGLAGTIAFSAAPAVIAAVIVFAGEKPSVVALSSDEGIGVDAI